MPDTRERVRIEDGPKRVRTYLGGELIADTKRPKLVWEVPYYPAYYFPQADARMELLSPNGHTRRSTSRGEAHNFNVKAETARSRTPPGTTPSRRSRSCGA